MLRPLLLSIALLASVQYVAAQETVYEIGFPNAVHHEAEVTATFRGLPAGPLQVRMARSSPGRYALHEFAKNVYAVRAVDGQGRALAITRPDPHQWDVGGHDGTVRFSYTLFADRADGTYSGIDPTHAHLNIPATFVYAAGLDARPIRVTFRVPAGSGWKVATQLAPTEDPYTFTAPHFQYFMDSPTEVSDFDLREWTEPTADGRSPTIRIALHHQGTDAELDAYAGMAKKVVKEQEAVFGELPDFDYGTYTFIADYLPWVAGDGMEHRNSTILSSTTTLAANALGVLGTLSHEFFHAWNVERIRPDDLEPFAFDRANMTGTLWFAEGFTSYYDDLFIRRAGITNDTQYVSAISGLVNGVVNGNGRDFFSPIEMSMQAPFVDAGVSNDPTNRGNTFISYYNWGAAIGLGLDLTIRSRFPGKSLDDFMRAMWLRHGTAQENRAPVRPYTLADLETVLGEVTDRAFAQDFFDRFIDGRDVPDYETLLAKAGVLVRPARREQATLGPANLQFADGRAVVRSYPLIGSSWYDAGISFGDEIISVDGAPLAGPQDLAALTQRHRPGDRVPVVFEQRGQQKSATLTFGEDERIELVTYESAGMAVTDEMRAFREAWLASKGN
jgi:predicted metalloprotease with PDZ domain